VVGARSNVIRRSAPPFLLGIESEAGAAPTSPSGEGRSIVSRRMCWRTFEPSFERGAALLRGGRLQLEDPAGWNGGEVEQPHAMP
jgi:hypothetical protein